MQSFLVEQSVAVKTDTYVQVNASEDVTTGIHTCKMYTFSPTVLTMLIKKNFITSNLNR